jgi:hypothetical protein
VDDGLRATSCRSSSRFTTIEVHPAAETDALDLERAGSLTTSLVFSWDKLTLGSGLSFGKLFLDRAVQSPGCV